MGELNATVPVGVIGPPASASETVAVQIVEAVTATGEGEHATLVVLARGATSITVPGSSSEPSRSSTVTVAL